MHERLDSLSTRASENIFAKRYANPTRTQGWLCASSEHTGNHSGATVEQKYVKADCMAMTEKKVRRMESVRKRARNEMALHSARRKVEQQLIARYCS
jgi:hypothetical protein